MTTLQRIALGLEYCGKEWLGWQSQPCGRTVQDRLESALEKIVQAPVSVICAGRTDTGVHARHQVVHFETPQTRPLSAWVRGTNSHLPDSIAVLWAKAVPDEFHARFSARGRRYRYLLMNRPQKPGLLSGKVGWYHRPLDLQKMQLAARSLLGTHDFSAFRAAQCQAKSPIKTLLAANLSQRGEVISFEFAADAFLHHMIRNLVGTLVYIGAGREPVTWINHLLQQGNRQQAAPTFAPDGLYFLGPHYEAHWNLPTVDTDFFLPG